jgi:hypothetical protein
MEETRNVQENIGSVSLAVDFGEQNAEGHQDKLEV